MGCCASSVFSQGRPAGGRRATRPKQSHGASRAGFRASLTDGKGPRIPPPMATLASAPTPEQLVAELVLLLDIEPRGGDRFLGRKLKEGSGRVFGGQAIAQA